MCVRNPSRGKRPARMDVAAWSFRFDFRTDGNVHPIPSTCNLARDSGLVVLSPPYAAMMAHIRWSRQHSSNWNSTLRGGEGPGFVRGMQTRGRGDETEAGPE